MVIIAATITDGDAGCRDRGGRLVGAGRVTWGRQRWVARYGSRADRGRRPSRAGPAPHTSGTPPHYPAVTRTSATTDAGTTAVSVAGHRHRHEVPITADTRARRARYLRRVLTRAGPGAVWPWLDSGKARGIQRSTPSKRRRTHSWQPRFRRSCSRRTSGKT